VCHLRLVGAPLVGALVEGTHKGCPYETRKLFAKKTKIYGIAMQGANRLIALIAGFPGGS
jgi:hypothetical protein